MQLIPNWRRLRLAANRWRRSLLGGKGRSHGSFDPELYARHNPDIRVAGYEPLAYALDIGRFEGRGPQDPIVRSTPERPFPRLSQIVAGAHRATSSQAAIDVIIPVFRGLANTLRTIGSVLAAPDRERFEIVVIDDASPEPKLAEALAALQSHRLITRLVNARNLGFVESVNRGMALHQDRDVILLNSDTEVFGDGLSRLVAHLERSPRAATVTPLSNAATILSYPIWLKDNHADIGMDYARLDRVAARAHSGVAAVIPTGIGFCMAMRRAALAELGPFNADAFGRGYGEESDYCWRARAAGWQNLAACDVFVWHAGGGSFGPEREALVAGAQKTLARLHPDYAPAIRDFLRSDSLRSIRTALDMGRLRALQRPIVLHLHGSPEPPPAVLTMPGSTIQLFLIPDIRPRHGALRVVAPFEASFVNLPRLSRGSDVSAFAEELGQLPGLTVLGNIDETSIRAHLARALNAHPKVRK